MFGRRRRTRVRLYDWDRLELLAGFDPGWARWLLARRSIPTTPGEEPEMAYYVCAGPVATSLEQLMAVAGSRWRIEECFAAAWYRHITLAMPAHAYLSATRATAERGLRSRKRLAHRADRARAPAPAPHPHPHARPDPTTPPTGPGGADDATPKPTTAAEDRRLHNCRCSIRRSFHDELGAPPTGAG
ncbi:hypothetical protein [Blastococcus mobilis]|uniref:hypothetical protein n=1 Tax=Blastococcus mobilis TaxID=1938746 RepID=UPI0020CC3A0F|nr:hypothetical protein [Blastococcus mobilis]